MNNVFNFITQNSENTLQRQIDQALQTGSRKRISLSKGLSLVTKKSGQGEFIFRVQKNRKRLQIKLGVYKKECLPHDLANGELDLDNAIHLAQKLQDLAARGLHPVKELRSAKYSVGTTVDAVFQKVLQIKMHKVKSTAAIERNYRNEVAPFIGHFSIKQTSRDDIQSIINNVLKSGRRSVAEKTLYLCKNLFDYASENNICSNVTRTMTVRENAGGIAPHAGIALAEHDLENTFRLMRENQAIFNETLYCLTILLVSLGLRKSELVTAKWINIDQSARLLHIEREVAKNKIAIAVPLSIHLQPILDKLQKLSNGSEYLFSAFLSSSRNHMSASTPNCALNRLFKTLENNSSERIQRFTIHDLRRTFRTLLSRLNIPKDIADLCINHRDKNAQGLAEVERYDRYVKLNERRNAYDKIAQLVMHLAKENNSPQLQLVA